MNILILMAGGSEKFEQAGYLYPKNLIEVAGKPVVEHIVETTHILNREGNRFVFAVNKEECVRYHTGAVIKLLLPNAEVLKVSQQTAGAACTALLAIDFINNDEPLLIINGDIVGDFRFDDAVNEFVERDLDGGILVFSGIHPRWSYVKCNEEGFVVETAEKRPISRHATVGIYYFRKGKDFVETAMEMIKKDAQVDGRFFVCPSYNEMILQQKKIGVFEIARESYYSLATPQGLATYEEHLKSREGGRRTDDADRKT